MKNRRLILKAEKRRTFMDHLEPPREIFVTGLIRKRRTFMDHLQPPREIFVTGLIRKRRTSDTKISSKKKLHNKLKKTVQVKRTTKM
jgi:phage terminase large subunit-like protein